MRCLPRDGPSPRLIPRLSGPVPLSDPPHACRHWTAGTAFRRAQVTRLVTRSVASCLAGYRYLNLAGLASREGAKICSRAAATSFLSVAASLQRCFLPSTSLTPSSLPHFRPHVPSSLFHRLSHLTSRLSDARHRCSPCLADPRPDLVSSTTLVPRCIAPWRELDTAPSIVPSISESLRLIPCDFRIRRHSSWLR